MIWMWPSMMPAEMLVGCGGLVENAAGQRVLRAFAQHELIVMGLVGTADASEVRAARDTEAMPVLFSFCLCRGVEAWSACMCMWFAAIHVRSVHGVDVAREGRKRSEQEV